jgi:hypothetical protein
MFAAGVVLILGGLALAVANKRPAPEERVRSAAALRRRMPGQPDDEPGP